MFACGGATARAPLGLVLVSPGANTAPAPAPAPRRLRDFNRFYPADERRRTREEVEVAVFESSRKKPMALLVPVDEGVWRV